MEKMQDAFMRAKWIQTEIADGRDGVVLYEKAFNCEKKAVKARLYITACGVYCAFVNGVRVSEPMAPGFDCYPFRMPYFVYDITDSVSENNVIAVSVARGWYGWLRDKKSSVNSEKRSMKAAVAVIFDDGTEQVFATDNSWTARRWNCVSSDIYDGEFYDASRERKNPQPVTETALEEDGRLILSDGERICEHERLTPVRSFVTPKGEYVIDFGQNVTGYVEFSVTARAGETLEISHAEELDKNGDFYTDNYRSAKAKLTYICKDGTQSYKPLHTFYGFRYIRLDEKPDGTDEKNFVAIAVYSDIKRTGYIETSDETLNKFCENVIWGQKDNFLDIPTDCPQRDERLGWTGDAQAFCRAANYNFDCEKFYARWLKMLRCEQKRYGHTPNIVPDAKGWEGFSAAWADAATIIPWEVYRAYGNEKLLAENFPAMKRHVDSITESTATPFLWTGGDQLGDWLGLDAPAGSLKGSSDEDFIASAFYAYSTKLTVLAGKELGENVEEYERLYDGIREKFVETYPEPETQTECALALVFGLAADAKKTAARLADKIVSCGGHLETGFVGTPYLLHALSENGYTDLAYSLLLREEFPSWLYSVKRGATTVWEHWDGKDENGNFWSPEMNSFNHYAYGAVVDWIYGVAAGITPAKPGYKKIKIAPAPTERLNSLRVRLYTRQGLVYVGWSREKGKTKYEILTPAQTEIVIDGQTYNVAAGKYEFNK